MFGIQVACMQGRVHFYEGYPLWKVGLCIRVLKMMGVENLIVTNAAGSINQLYKVGDIMILKDHINIMSLGGDSPLRGKNDHRLGSRFLSMTSTYDSKIREKMQLLVKKGQIIEDEEEGGKIIEGVYVMVVGPQLETPAELRALRILGGDAIGMSTVPEVIVARHSGIRVFAFSMITNVGILEGDTGLEAYVNINEVSKMRRKTIQNLLKAAMLEMDEASTPNPDPVASKIQLVQ